MMTRPHPSLALLAALVPLALAACGSSGKSGSNSPATSPPGTQPGGGSDGGAPVIDSDAGGVPPGPPGTLSVWTTGLGGKVQPTTVPGSGTSITVSSPRAAWASGQVVVYGKAGVLTGVTVAVPSDLSDGAGHTLAKSNVTFFREYYIDFTGVKATTGNVPVPSKSPTNDAKIPDPLVPLIDPYTGANAGQPFNVAQSSNQPVWVDVYVPTGTTAGTYTGTIHVAGSGGTADIPLSVTVWDIDLPDMRTVTTEFKLSVNALLQYHTGISTCSSGGTDCYLNENAQCLKVVQRYEELAHEHRVDSGEVFVVSPGGSSCTTVPTDWTDYDAKMTPYMSGSYWKDGIPSSRLESPFSPGETYGLDACTQSQYVALATAWAAHLKAKGWFPQTITYAYDEPPASVDAAIAQGSAWLQQGDPDWLATVMDTVSPTTSNIGALGPAIGIYTVNLPEYDDWNYNVFYGRADWPTLFAKGTKLWFYESNSVVPPYPTFASNTMDGLEPVMAMWGSWYEKASGFLYWDMASWTDKAPWGTNIGYGMTGDGVLIYPGNHNGTMAPVGSPSDVAIDGPIPSYRLKMVRNGMQDWALFRLADTKGLTSTVQTQVGTVYSQLGGCSYGGCPAKLNGSFYWKTDETAMNAARLAVANAIVAAK